MYVKFRLTTRVRFFYSIIVYSVILGITYGIGLGLQFQMLFQDQQMMLIFYVEVLLGKITVTTLGKKYCWFNLKKMK